MKKRFVIFTFLTAVSAAFTIIFSLSFCSLIAVNTDFAGNVDEMIVDGTDFTPVMEMGGLFLDLFMNEIMPAVMYIGFFIMITLLNLVLFGFYGLFGLRGVPEPDTVALRLTRRVFGTAAVALTAVTAVISLCGMLFGGSSAYCFFNLLLCWQYPLFAWLFCLRRMKKLITA